MAAERLELDSFLIFPIIIIFSVRKLGTPKFICHAINLILSIEIKMYVLVINISLLIN